MSRIRGLLLGIALFQLASTTLGAVELLLAPEWFAPLLDGSLFEGQYGLASMLLGIVVGGPQAVAAFTHLRHPRWLPLGHATAATVMIGWIAGECLVIDSFLWPHALWGGIGLAQLLLVLVLLGVHKPFPTPD